MKILKILAWVLLFPFMLTYWGWKNSKKPAMIIGIILSLIVVVGVGSQEDASSEQANTADNDIVVEDTDVPSNNENDTSTTEETDRSTDLNANDYNYSNIELINVNEELLKEATGLTSEELQTVLDLIDENKLDCITDIKDGIGESVDTLKSFRVWFGDEQALITFENRKLYYFHINDTELFVYEEAIEETAISEVSFVGYTMIEVDGGNLSGYRQPNVVVDIGFGDREYYAFTNEYGQLVKVIASEIILQNDSTEPVLSTGRYYSDEAKVPGVESLTLDEGHVIADSLGGVANSYNITPQDSTLNRHGDQAYMEKIIRDANGCTDFTAIITYPDNTTQIPDHYSFSYTLQGTVIQDEFDNVDPDEVIASDTTNETEDTASTTDQDDTVNFSESLIQISMLDKVDEYIILTNNGNQDVDLQGWRILSVTGTQDYYFVDYKLKVGESVKIGDSGKGTVDIHWLEGRGIWNNSKSDPAELYNSNGLLVDRWDD